MHLKLTLFSIIALFLFENTLMGCARVKNLALAHKIEIRQGNVFSDETIAQLKPGMKAFEAEFLLGPPSIMDTFHQDRWDYVYSLEKDNKHQELKHIILYFKGDELERIEKNYSVMPAKAGIQGF